MSRKDLFTDTLAEEARKAGVPGTDPATAELRARAEKILNEIGIQANPGKSWVRVPGRYPNSSPAEVHLRVCVPQAHQTFPVNEEGVALVGADGFIETISLLSYLEQMGASRWDRASQLRWQIALLESLRKLGFSTRVAIFDMELDDFGSPGAIYLEAVVAEGDEGMEGFLATLVIGDSQYR